MPRIQTNEVIAEIEATKIASLELKAPIGVGVDLKTGELTKTVKVELVGDPVLKQTIVPGKLINEGFLEAILIIKPEEHETKIYLPIFSVTKIDGIKKGDRITETSELEHISISGLPEVVPVGHSGYKVKIFVRALLKIQITVTREEIISLPENENSKLPKSSSDRDPKTKQTISNKTRLSKRYNNRGNWNRYWAYMHR